MLQCAEMGWAHRNRSYGLGTGTQHKHCQALRPTDNMFGTERQLHRLPSYNVVPMCGAAVTTGQVDEQHLFPPPLPPPVLSFMHMRISICCQ